MQFDMDKCCLQTCVHDNDNFMFSFKVVKRKHRVYILNLRARSYSYTPGLSISIQLKIIAIKTYHSVWVNKVQNNGEGTEWNWTPMLHSHLRYGDFISFQNKYLCTHSIYWSLQLLCMQINMNIRTNRTLNKPQSTVHLCARREIWYWFVPGDWHGWTKQTESHPTNVSRRENLEKFNSFDLKLIHFCCRWKWLNFRHKFDEKKLFLDSGVQWEKSPT